MAQRTPLAAVNNTATKPARRRSAAKPVTNAASDGDGRAMLIAMRARVATAVDDPNTPPRDLAALTRRLMEITKDIEAMDAREDGSAGGAAAPDESFDASAI